MMKTHKLNFFKKILRGNMWLMLHYYKEGLTTDEVGTKKSKVIHRLTFCRHYRRIENITKRRVNEKEELRQLQKKSLCY